MATSVRKGWVMVPRDNPDFILEFTWNVQRRHAVDRLQRVVGPERIRRSVLREWKPVKATSTIETE